MDGNHVHPTTFQGRTGTEWEYRGRSRGNRYRRTSATHGIWTFVIATTQSSTELNNVNWGDFFVELTSSNVGGSLIHYPT